MIADFAGSGRREAADEAAGRPPEMHFATPDAARSDVRRAAAS
jgi:hypothetical protein